jgi:hypothetical protein
MTMMYRLIISALIFAFFHLSLAQSLYNDRDEGRKVYQRYKNRPKGSFSKILDKGDRAIGVMDRGEIANVTGNFGVISNSPILFWATIIGRLSGRCGNLHPRSLDCCRKL